MKLLDLEYKVRNLDFQREGVSVYELRVKVEKFQGKCCNCVLVGQSEYVDLV